MLGFLGPNGAGKTTSMRAVFGLVRLDSGGVRWRGAAIGEAERRTFGYLPEQRGLYPKMKIGEQLTYFARLHGLERREAESEAKSWLERLGLGGRFTSKLEELSHGNQQRVQLAVALIHQPDLLVLDEPFSGLDPMGVDEMASVLSEQAAQGTAVVFSSHQLELVEDLCDDVAIIASGRIVLQGEVADLKREAPVRLLEVGGAARPEALDRLAGVHHRSREQGHERFLVDADTDPVALLDALGGAEHFAFTPPSLEDLFREAVGNGGAR